MNLKNRKTEIVLIGIAVLFLICMVGLISLFPLNGELGGWETQTIDTNTAEITISDFDGEILIRSADSSEIVSQKLINYDESVTVTFDSLEKGETVYISPIKDGVPKNKFQYHHHPEIYG